MIALILINGFSDDKNGLFDSDDEEDVQYNSDEGEPEKIRAASRC